jgi:putative phage-type endonuclease
MLNHDLIQGTPEWHAHRATHFNASDAPAIMGCSAYKTRSQLMHEMHTGLAPEVDAGTQRRFDDGHRFEAMARPLAEKIIGEALYPVTGSKGKYSASFDGLTMDECLAFEHKTLNEELRSCMTDQGNGYGLPHQYQVQMEQQLMVSGADRVLFMASKWAGDVLIEEHHCWYASDDTLREAIERGWEQFDIDLAAYVPTEVVVPSPTGKAPDTLPALRIEVTGMVTASNLAEFKETALTAIHGVNRELSTDSDFADAEKAVKWCGDVEERLAAAKQHALSQTASIDELFRTIDDISAEARRVRLDLEKLVKVRKESIRGEIVAEGVKALAEHIAALNVRLGKNYMPHMPADFGGAIKGKRTVESLRNAVDTLLANTKIAASAIADKISINLAALNEVAFGFKFLFSDLDSIVLKAPDDLRALAENRMAAHKAEDARKETEQRERIRADEVARLAREQTMRDMEASRQAAAAADLAAAKKAEEKVALAPVIIAPAAIENVADTVPESLILAGERVVIPMTLPVLDTGVTIKLGEICARIAPLSITADGLASLGFPFVATDKSAKLYRECDFGLICASLISHINQVQTRQAA